MVGVCHAYSDVDLYAVGSRSFDSATMLEIDGYAVQFNLISSETFATLGSAYSTFRVSTADKSQVEDHVGYSKIASRICSGHTLISPRRSVENVSLPDVEVYRHVGMVAESMQTDRMLEDAAGSLAVADGVMASRASHLALESSLKLFLLATGTIHQSDAATWRQAADTPCLSRAGLASVVLSHVSPDFPQEDLVPTPRSRVRVASALANISMLDGWDEPITQLHNPRLFDDAPAGTISISPFHSVLRLVDALGINGLDRGMRTNESTARYWLSLHGRPPKADTYEESFRRKGLIE